MTKTHKEIAVFMTRQAENAELSDKLFIKVSIKFRKFYLIKCVF